MNEFKELLSVFPLPYQDLIAVALLLIIFYVISLLISRIFTQIPVSEPPETESEQPVTKPEIEEMLSDIPPSAPEAEGIQDAFKTPGSDGSGLSPAEEQAEQPVEVVPEEIKIEEKQETAEPMVTDEAPEPEIEEAVPEPEKPETLFSRLRKGLSKTQDGLFGKLNVILSKNQIDEETWEEFEESLISSDIGVATTIKLKEKIQENLSKKELADPSDIMAALREEILNILKNAEGEVVKLTSKPTIMIVAGVNGVGKTTTIGKLANKFINEGKKVMVAAADTFRAAAIEQLEVWSNRVGSDFIKGSPGADPSAVAFDAVQASQARGIDLLIIDTAGRLHTKSNLMDELVKIKRVVGKELSDSPHEVLVVLDATTGQNAIQQAKTFNEAIDVSGIVLTKLDGTAKGGVIIAIADELNIPVKYIGIGEGLDDLRNFDAEEFVEALFESEGETIH